MNERGSSGVDVYCIKHEQFSSDAKVAALTSDIVWLVEREVKLAGNRIELNVSGDLINMDTIAEIGRASCRERV